MTTLHGSAVARGGGAVLILGASGAGKSTLALQLMALGAGLVADDAVKMRVVGDDVILACPQSIKGLIEARRVGLLSVRSVDTATLAFVVDMDKTADSRLPESTEMLLLGRRFPLICGKRTPNLAAVVWNLLGGGQILPSD